MYVMRIGRALSVVSVAISCVACGGGGGSGGGPTSTPDPPPAQGTPPSNQPPASLPTFSVTGTTFSFSSDHANVTPGSQPLPVSISGSVNGILYLQSTSDDGRIANASINYSGASGQQPTVDAFIVPAPSSTLLAGTYTTSITITACVNDSTC